MQSSHQEFKEYLEAVNLSPPEFVGFPSCFGPLEKFRQPCSDVTDEDRLELGRAPADQRQDRTAPNHCCEPVEEVIILAKHEARPDDRRLREYRSNGPLSLSLCLVRDGRRRQ